jgi:Domain of unknown function (DUF222)/HNH endonuclease
MGELMFGWMDEDLSSVSTDRLDAEIGELAAHINAATARLLALVAEFDRRRGHWEWGFGDCARWLSWRCSLAPRAAREHVRVARALEDLPLVRAAFERGELSYSKVRALTRVAVEADEADLVRIALEATAAQLERIVGAYRGVLSLADAVEADRRRHLSYRWEADGSLSFRGRLGATEGELFLRALAAGRELAWAIPEADGGPAEPPAHDPRRASNADALAAMAEACLASAAADSSGGDRHQLVVHLDETRAELEGGPVLAAASARRLACDAAVVAIAESGGEAISVGRRTRTIPPSIRRALRARDRGCRFPGCGAHHFTDAHHIRHWADGGETSLSNLVLLCRRHHRLLHEHGFTVGDGADGELVFHSPDGRVVPPCPAAPRGHPSRLRALSASRGLRIDPKTCFPRSAGARMDLELTIWNLCDRRERDGPGGASPAAAVSGPS